MRAGGYASPKGRSHAAGVTVVELALVLLILGIVASIGAPRFFSRSAFHERFFAEDVLSALRYAQKLAVASGCEVEVDLAGNAYALSQRQSCDTGPFDRAVPDPGSGGDYTNQAPAGTALASSVNPIVFDRLGRALDASLAVADATVTVGAQSINVVGESGFSFDPAS